jgi:hypothetical protein
VLLVLLLVPVFEVVNTGDSKDDIGNETGRADAVAFDIPWRVVVDV